MLIFSKSIFNGLDCVLEQVLPNVEDLAVEPEPPEPEALGLAPGGEGFSSLPPTHSTHRTKKNKYWTGLGDSPCTETREEEVGLLVERQAGY